MKNRRTILKTMAAAAFAAVVSAGLVSGGMSAMAADKMTKVRVGDQTGSEVDYAAIWVAEMNGYYKDVGIELERKTYANGPATLLDLNNLDAATAAIAPHMQFVARGGELVIVMSMTKGNAPIVGKKKYKSVKELDGQKVGTPGLGTIHDGILGYVADVNGVKFQHVPAKISDVAVMIQKGEVEAFIGWEPASAAAVAKAPDLLHYIQRMPPVENSESLQLAFRPGFVKENPKVAEDFVYATLRAMKWIEENGDEATAKLVAEKMNDPDAYKVNLDALKSVDVTKPRLDMPSTELWLKTIAKQGKIPEELVKDVDAWVGKYLDYSFLDKAEARLKAN